MKANNIKILFFTIAVISFGFASTTAAEGNMGGLVVNKTISWFGQDFFAQFTREWRNTNYNGQGIVIEEVPSARKGTLIVVRYQGDVVFQASIAGTRQRSREIGSHAVRAILVKIQNKELASLGMSQPDLARDEI